MWTVLSHGMIPREIWDVIVFTHFVRCFFFLWWLLVFFSVLFIEQLALDTVISSFSYYFNIFWMSSISEMPYEEIPFSAYLCTEQHICQHQDVVSWITIGFPQEKRNKFFLWAVVGLMNPVYLPIFRLEKILLLGGTDAGRW